MNKAIKIFALGALALTALASCSQKADFVSESFVRFNGTSISVDENAEIIKIPVYAFGKDGSTVSIPRAETANTTVTFNVTDGTAKGGVDFTFAPADGILKFENSSVAYIEVTPIAHEGEYTGNLNFYINLKSASEDFHLAGSALCTATVTIKDVDHPLSSILGEYDVVSYFFDNGSIYIGRYTAELQPVDGDISAVIWNGINQMAADYDIPVKGYVSSDMQTITFPGGQVVDFSTGYGDLQLFSSDYVNSDGTKTGYYTYDEDIVFTADGRGGFTSPNGAAFVDKYVWPEDGGFGVGVRTGRFIGADLTTTWTKK